MKRRTSRFDIMIRNLVFAAAAIAMSASASLGMSKVKPSASYEKVMQVVNSTELSDAKKIARLKALASSEETRMIALMQLDRIDPKEAMQTTLAAFRAKGAPRQVKLQLGHFMLEGNRPQKEGFPKSFVEEFARFLVTAILDDGQKEFCQKLDGLSLTAVGEYAYLASDFQGYKNIDFAPFKDGRVVPVLIQCLDAPDNVYPKDQGDLIRGTPGESTGRNTARQQVPVALAKLGDISAVEPLKAVLFEHHDIYGRMNASYALARLLKQRKDQAAVGKEILAKPELLWCRFPYGKGLIESGDDAGVEFMAIEHAGGYGRLEYPREIFNMLNQRLSVLEGFSSPKVEGFVREALAFKPLRGMLLFEAGSVKIDPVTYVNPRKDDAEALDRVAPEMITIYGALLKCVETNGLKGLSAELEEIAKRTRIEKIRQMTNACLKSLASTLAAEGKLSIAEHANQIGVIANRSIEEDGRVVKIIYYRLADPTARPPYKESDLVQAGVRTFKYDLNGRAYRTETTGLSSVMPIEETRRNEDGSLRDITWSHGSGSVSHRNIYRGNTCVTELRYNADGAVAGIRGEVPPDHDLPAWGKPVDDVACAVLTSRARGTFAGLGLWITARNTGKLDRKIVTTGKTIPEFLIEVRRADGTLVKQEPQYVKRQFERRQAGNPNERDAAQSLSPGKAELVAWGRELTHWYADLPAGKYQVTVTCRSGDEFNAVSNTAAFEIVPAESVSAPATQPATQAKD